MATRYSTSPDSSAQQSGIPVQDEPLATPANGLFIGTGGDVSLEFQGTAVVFKNLRDGQVLPISVFQVNTANTTAQDLVALNSDGSEQQVIPQVIQVNGIDILVDGNLAYEV